jgi:hypothetical protein
MFPADTYDSANFDPMALLDLDLLILIRMRLERESNSFLKNVYFDS